MNECGEEKVHAIYQTVTLHLSHKIHEKIVLNLAR